MSNSWIGKKARQAIYDRDQMICCYCGVECTMYDPLNPGKVTCVSLDHIVPQKELAESATDDKHFYALRKDAKNLVLVCMACNSSKQHIPLFVWCAQTGKNYAAIIAEIAKRIAIPLYNVKVA